MWTVPNSSYFLTNQPFLPPVLQKISQMWLHLSVFSPTLYIYASEKTQKHVLKFNDQIFLLTQLGKADQVGTRWQRSRSIRMTITHDWSPLALAFSAVKSRLVYAQEQKHTVIQHGGAQRGATLLFTMEAYNWIKNS